MATQPYAVGNERNPHQRQQRELAAMVARNYAADEGVAYVNLGNAIDLMDDRLSERYRELMLNPAVSMFGLMIAWQAYDPLFHPLFRVALHCLYPGHFST